METRMLADAHTIHETATTFLERHVDEFAPFQWEHPSERSRRQKSFAELSMYWYLSATLGGGDETVGRFVTDRVNDDQYVELLYRYPDRLTQNAFPAVAAEALGELNSDTAADVERALSADSLWGGERLPYEWIALISLRQLWGFDTHPRSLSAAMESSALAHPPDIVKAEIDAFYHLTHDVMLPLAFGSGHSNAESSPLPYDIELTLVGGLLRAVAASDADAALELLITGILQEQLPKRLVRHVFKWVRQQRLADSYVVQTTEATPSEWADNGAPQKPHYPDDWGEATRRWAAHYHANIVAATATFVASDRYPPESGASASLSSSFFEAAVGLGQALNELHAYDLEGAADTVLELPREAFTEFPQVTGRVRDFLANQRREDGFGYWAEERRMFEIQNGQTTGFDSQMVGPLKDSCEMAIDRLSNELSRSNHGHKQQS